MLSIVPDRSSLRHPMFSVSAHSRHECAVCHCHALLDPWDHLTWVLGASQTFLSLRPHPILRLISEQLSLSCSTARPVLSLQYLGADVSSCDLLVNAAFQPATCHVPKTHRVHLLCLSMLLTMSLFMSHHHSIASLKAHGHRPPMAGLCGHCVVTGSLSLRELPQHFGFLSKSTLKEQIRPHSNGLVPCLSLGTLVQGAIWPKLGGNIVCQ